MRAGQQVARLQPVQQVLDQRLDLHQHQGVEVGQQPVDRAHAVGRRHDGHCVVLLGERFAHIRAGRGARLGARDGAHRHPLVQPAHSTRNSTSRPACSQGSTVCAAFSQARASFSPSWVMGNSSGVCVSGNGSPARITMSSA